MSRCLPLALVLAAAGCALPGGPAGGPADEEGVIILDDGFPEAGPAPDAGEDAGFILDAGFEEYEGEPEPGVRCGVTLDTCDPGASCCLGGDPFTVACSPTGDAVCPDGVNNNLRCDGPEDCAAPVDAGPDAGSDAGAPALACCLGGDVAAGLTTTCREPLACVNDLQPVVCTSTADCFPGLTCCGFAGALVLPIDLGVCAPTCELSLEAP